MPRGRRDVDDLLITTLACGATQEAAAQKVQVSLATVRRRMQDPRFRSRLTQARTEMVQRSAGTLTAAHSEAIRTLLELQKSSVPPATRLGAARAIIELGTRLRESAELLQRVTELEERLNAKP
jgi:hypothetical protein